MEIIQLCDNVKALYTSGSFKLPGIISRPMPVQIYSPDSNTFVGTVQLEGTIAGDAEVAIGAAKWSLLSGAIWTIEVIDAVFVQVTHIRVKISEYISGSISVRIGF